MTTPCAVDSKTDPHRTRDEEEPVTERTLLVPINDNGTAQGTTTAAWSSSAVMSLGWFWSECQTWASLSIPTMVINLSFVVPHVWSASYIGRTLDPVHLSGFALATLTGNVFQGTLLQGLFNASDTLSPQAFGAQQYRELGLLAIRGSVASLVLVILPLTVVLWVWMPDILVQGLGQDEEASRVAADFYRVYSVGLPAYALYCIVWKFLSAQSILWPLVVSTLVSTLLVFPVALTVLLEEGSGGGGLFFFLGHFGEVTNTTNDIGNVNMGTDEQQAGFLAPAAATSIYYMSQCLLVLLLVWYWQPHHPATWTKGFLWDATVWRQALAWQPLSQYLSLGLGGILTYLEWVYWEALSLMVGTFGVVPLSAHAIPSQVLDVAYMIPWGMGIALSIRLGQVLASSSVKLDKNQSLSFRTSTRNAIRNSKLLAVTALLVSVLVFGVGALVLYQAQDWIVVRLFTHHENKDAAVAELCRQIWGHVALLFFVLGMYAMVIGIAVGLGLQWTLGIVTVVCLWCVGVPTAYWFAVQRQGGLVAAWSCFWPPYLLINGIMCLVFFVTTDWEDIVDEIQQREQQQQEAKEGQGEHTKEHESQP